MEGRPLAAGELARLARVAPSTISEHLAALVEGGLVVVVNAGRHRYYRLINPEVAAALEALSRICPTTPVRSLRQANAARSLRLARRCYDHIAGTLGVALFERMLSLGWLEQGSTADFVVTSLGDSGLAGLGVDVPACRRSRRHFARPCVDWTERRAHLAGSLGAGIATAMFDRGWVRTVATGRGLRISPDGLTGIREAFDLSMEALDG